MSNLIGQRIGQYEIIGLLGKGGMASVYRAQQTSMGRQVAVKVIEPRLAETEEFLRRFEREARIVAGLSHLHILKVFDYGQQGTLVYLVMELLEGGSLADSMRRGPLSMDLASRLLDQIASALDYAHRRGILHRDVKPQNVLLDSEGNAHLTDFGIAKIVFETASLTAGGVAMGTPSYMSPEQFQGLPLDSRADIYALGIMLFEMLTGKLPFVANTPAEMGYKHLQAPPPPIRSLRPDLPPGVESVIAKALAKNREQRFSTAAELAAAFKAALAGQMPAAPINANNLTNPMPLIEGMSEMSAQAHISQPMLSEPAKVTPSLQNAAPATQKGRSVFIVIGVIVVLIVAVGVTLGILANRPTQPTATITNGPTETAPAIVLMPSFTTTQESTSSSASITTITATSLPATPTATVTIKASPTFSRTPVPSATFTATLTPTEAPNPSTRAAATIAARSTLTANAVASFTATPTSLPTQTPNDEQTVAAIVGKTETAIAEAVPTKTLNPTPTQTLGDATTLTPGSKQNLKKSLLSDNPDDIINGLIAAKVITGEPSPEKLVRDSTSLKTAANTFQISAAQVTRITDFVLSTDITFGSADDNNLYCGVFYHATFPQSNAITAFFTRSRKFYVYIAKNNSFKDTTPILDGVDSPSISDGDLNRITLIVVGDAATLYVNGVQEQTWTDQTFSSGQVGYVIVNTSKDPSLECDFANTLVWSLK